MRKKKYPSNVIEQAQDVLQAWNQIGNSLTFGNINAAALTTELTSANSLVVDVGRLETQLEDKRNQRDVILASMWDKVKRVRASVKGSYGDDSYQYGLIGGTRISEKKPRSRKAAPQVE